MIVIFLQGGLGNQMFQYALGRNLAEKNKTEVVFDTTFLNDRFPRGGIAFYNYDLDVFGIAPRLTALSKISAALPIPGVWLGIDLALIKTRNMLGIRRIAKEKSPAFDQDILATGGNVLLRGYWQSEKYFEDIKDEIRAAFTFKVPLVGAANDIADEIRRTNSVSLHVRRGDYVTAPGARKMMGDTNLLYYKKAVAYIAERVKNPHFFIVSNDAAWCRENITIPYPVTYLDEATAGPKNTYHLRLMSLCRHNIIANSTFSWWAAWLNNNPEKIVVAPKQWYATTSSENMVPEAWMRI
jgi:hypothetical protein